jgi:hypothetical protein
MALESQNTEIQKEETPQVQASDIQWQAPSFHYKEKTWKWYLVMGFIVLIFVLYGLYTQSYVTAITFIVFAAVYYYLQKEKPKMVNVGVSESGIQFGKHFFPYGNIKEFWIYYEPDLHSLNISIVKKVFSVVNIDVPLDMPTSILRDYLLRYIPEVKDKQETLTENIIRNFGL